MTGQAVPAWFWITLQAVMGAIVGSFLNVCIHRMPRGDSIVSPRSRCYSCSKPVRWYDNLPLISYLLLGGKCRDCGARFSIRYWLVELLTAGLFVWIWQWFAPATACVYTVFVCGLLAATFIDFEHLIIPDEITYGGILVGVLVSGMVPSIQGEELHGRAALWSLAGAVVGWGSLWLVVELGKLVFGVKKVDLGRPHEVFLTSTEFRLGGDREVWEELFCRPGDELTFEATGVRMGERRWEKARIRVNYQRVLVDEEQFPLENLGELMAVTQFIRIPREAMGFGDVKFLAAIGAFLGLKAVFFVILVSSLTGSLVGLSLMTIGRKQWGLQIPYGPYLALAAFIWIMGGSVWLDGYLHWLTR